MTPKEILELIQKAAITTAAGGQLTDEQAKAFISTVVDQSEFLKKINVVPMKANTYLIDVLGIASRVMRKATQGVAPTDVVGVDIDRRELSTVEVILPYDVGFSFIEENIEGGNIEDKLNAYFAQQFSNDLLDLAINGDEAQVGDDFVGINDGWLKIAANDGSVHGYSVAGDDFKGTIFPEMLQQLPDKWKRNPADLVFLVSPTDEVKYRTQISEKNTALGDLYLVENRRAQYQGVGVEPIPFWPEGKVLLTAYKNLHAGIGRNMRVGRWVNERKRVVEYTITTKTDYNYALSDMIVYGG